MIKDTNTPNSQIEPIISALRTALDDDAHTDYMSALKAQVKALHDIHTIMIKESTPTDDQYWGPKKHDVKRLSLALRAQNQFCRSVLLLDHLNRKDTDKDKIENELNKP